MSGQLSSIWATCVVSLRIFEQQNGTRQLVWQELNEMLYLNTISWYLGFQGVYNAFTTKELLWPCFFFVKDVMRCIDWWDVSNPVPTVTCPLFISLFISVERINFPQCVAKASLFSPSFNLLYSLWIFLFSSLSCSLPLPPSESGSILLFRSLSAEEKKKAQQMWQIWSYVKITPTRQRFSLDRFLTQWLSLNPKLGSFSFLSFFFAFHHSQFFKARRERALKSTLSLIQ